MLKTILNSFLLNRNFKKQAALAFIILITLMCLCCGKRKPPLPPLEKVRQRAEVSGFQRGGQIILSWQMPARNASEGNISNIKSADIYRLAEAADAPLTLSEDEFASRSVLIGSLPIADTDFARKRVTYTDTLELAGQPARLRYAVRFVNSSGQKAAFSNFLLIEPTARTAAAPDALTAAVSQDSVSLQWTPPQNNIDGSKPLNLLGYNVYRSDSKSEAARLLNEKPIADARYSDEFFDFDRSYIYFVRAVSVGTGGTPIESGESNIVEVEPKDTFAPTAPSALTIAAVPGTISIFFAANPEKDIDGYAIYRTTDANLDRAEWPRLNQELLKTNTFQDTRVESGVTYFYYLKAVDTRGNTSDASEIVSETAP